MRFASYAPLSLMLVTALGCAAACSGDDDDDSSSATGGKSTTGGSGNTAGTTNQGGDMTAGGAGSGDSQLCTDLGGPAGIDAVVRGDGTASKSDAFNGFKFEKDGRQASVLLNVATDPCIGQQFAHLLAPDKAAELEHLAECLSLFVQNTAGCDVAYVGAKDKAGKVCLPMKGAHAGLGISEEDYTALITDAATALIAAGVDPTSEQFKAVAGALTADDLKADIISNDDPAYSKPGGMCEATGGAGGTATGGAAARAARHEAQGHVGEGGGGYRRRRSPRHRRDRRGPHALGAAALAAAAPARPGSTRGLPGRCHRACGLRTGAPTEAARRCRATACRCSPGARLHAWTNPAPRGRTLGRDCKSQLQAWPRLVGARMPRRPEPRRAAHLAFAPPVRRRAAPRVGRSLSRRRRRHGPGGALSRARARARRQRGPATSSVGTPSLAAIKASALATVVRSYGYRDYVASALLLNFGKRGLRLREQYQWLPPRAPA